MAKLLLKFVGQERISVKEGDVAKEQFSKVINDLTTVEEKKFLNFNKITDRLDTFYANLSFAEYSPLWKVFVIIFCMFHGHLLSVDLTLMQIWLLIINLIIL